MPANLYCVSTTALALSGEANMKLMTVPEAAAELGITVPRCYTLIREGILPAVYLGRVVRVSDVELEEWVVTGGRRFSGLWKKAAGR